MIPAAFLAAVRAVHPEAIRFEESTESGTLYA